MTELALGPVRAKAGEVAGAGLLARVPVPAARAVLAEAARKPWALVHLAQREARGRETEGRVR